MESKQWGNVPTHEGTESRSLETMQRIFNWKQHAEADQIDTEWLAQQREAEWRARFVALFNPCGVE